MNSMMRKKILRKNKIKEEMYIHLSHMPEIILRIFVAWWLIILAGIILLPLYCFDFLIRILNEFSEEFTNKLTDIYVSGIKFIAGEYK